MTEKDLQNKLQALQQKKAELEEKISMPEVYADLQRFAETATELQDVNEAINELSKLIDEKK